MSLLECVTTGGVCVDREAGVIRGVKVLSSESRNGRVYTPAALRGAVKLYEGVAVNVDHPDRERPGAERGVGERFGTLRNVRLKGNAVFADLHFLRSHPLSEMICEAAEEMPHVIGLSHNAVGQYRREGDLQVVESLSRVRSVDLVTDPATTGGLFESFHMRQRVMAKRSTWRRWKLISIRESADDGSWTVKDMEEAIRGVLMSSEFDDASKLSEIEAILDASIGIVEMEDDPQTAARREEEEAMALAESYRERRRGSYRFNSAKELFANLR